MTSISSKRDSSRCCANDLGKKMQTLSSSVPPGWADALLAPSTCLTLVCGYDFAVIGHRQQAASGKLHRKGLKKYS